MINLELAEQRGLDQEDIEDIEFLHNYRKCIFALSEECTRDGLQKELYKEWVEVEKELQRLWRFYPVDENYIQYWNFPACSCPKMDNNEAYPSGYYVYSGGCIIHGDKVNKGDSND